MKDNLSIVIVMLVFVILMVLFPLYNHFERQDDMSYNLALKVTTNFVDEVVNSGYITQAMYDNYIANLANTGNLYDIQLEVHKKTYTKDVYAMENGVTITDAPFIEQYYIDYNKDIFEAKTGKVNEVDIKSVDKRSLKNGTYYLNVGDQIYVKLKNSSTTMAGAIFNLIVPTSSIERIKINYGGIVKNNAWKETAISDLIQENIYIEIDLNKSLTIKEEDGYPTYVMNQSEKVKYDVKIQNYTDNINDIPKMLKENLKLSGFDNEKSVLPSSIDKKIGAADTWTATFELKSDDLGSMISDTPGAVLCTAQIANNVFHGKISSNPTVRSKDTIKIKKSATSGGGSGENLTQPELTGPYILGELSSKIVFGSTVTYKIKYFDKTIININENNMSDYIKEEGFTYSKRTFSEDKPNKEIKIVYSNVRGIPNDYAKFTLVAGWGKIGNATLQSVMITKPIYQEYKDRKENFIYNLFYGAYQRIPMTSEVLSWYNATGYTGEKYVSTFMFGKEVVDRKLNGREAIRRVYKIALMQEPTESDVSWWYSKSTYGTWDEGNYSSETNKNIVKAIATSDKAKSIYKKYLGE
ncbi:MAG: hypothetical protein PHP54_03440 [Clostridia bacterium]|nr:hypothetical protein [Clostridia bacterium]